MPALCLVSAKELIAKSSEFAILCGLQNLPVGFYTSLEESCIRKAISIGWSGDLKLDEERIYAACYIAQLHRSKLPAYIENMCQSIIAHRIKAIGPLKRQQIGKGMADEVVMEANGIIAKFLEISGPEHI